MSECLKPEDNTVTAVAARKLILSGLVQGVGFRPFIYRLAHTFELTGWVKNCVGTVEIAVQGKQENLQAFIDAIFEKNPPLSSPVLDAESIIETQAYVAFNIIESENQSDANISVPKDLNLCDDCLAELHDSKNRRYRYPFINCTQCGPRYTLIRALPYDRDNTTMAAFELCPDCLAEYRDPGDRRFHAEPVACPACGPQLSFRAAEQMTCDGEDALTQAVAVLQQGKVLAVKGIGGYHLMCDAGNSHAVSRLRENKPRPAKPLAVMFPSPLSDPFQFAEQAVVLTQADRDFLLQPSRPILLVAKKPSAVLSERISPGLSETGLMLPYSPLHHLLLDKFAGALVATSANISGEPVLTQNQDVEQRLQHVADAFLHHDRPIERPADDPVYRSIAGRPRPIRTGRGMTPLELTLPFELAQPVIAVGTQMKNTVALGWKDRVVISPHIGEMDTARSLKVFQDTIDDLQKLYKVEAEHVICDAHPGYTTTGWSKKQPLPVSRVYHHHAHASSAYYECHQTLRTSQDILVFCWDGVGYGVDGSLWGGESFIGKPGRWTRVASMRPFFLPGGDSAGRQPWRSAAALCWETGADYDDIPVNDPLQLSLLRQAWQKKVNTPQTSSVGRLFDAAAALGAVCTQASFEGQGPMQLEALCDSSVKDAVPLEMNADDDLWQVDWQPLVALMLDNSIGIGQRAAMFHNSLARTILQQAMQVREKHGIETVSFSGGVFQNRVLTETAIALLQAEGFEVCLPELIPVNDAGISFGQIMEYGFTL